ncbi:MAG: hypothetical protein AB8C46_20000 [Burkholderiaceae bacterium]
MTRHHRARQRLIRFGGSVTVALAMVLQATLVTAADSTASSTVPPTPTPSISSAATLSSAPNNALVEQVWQTTRLDSLSQAMANNLLEGIRHHPDLQTLSLERRERLIAHYQRYTSPGRFADGLKSVLRSASTEQLLALLHLSQSEVARQALKHELSFVPVSLEIMLEYATSVDNTPDGSARRESIRRLDRAIGVTDVAVTVSATTLYGAAMAMRELSAPATASAPGDLNRLVSEFIEQARPRQASMIEITYLYLYRHMSASDLATYVGLQENETVRAVQRQFVRSLGEEMIGIQRDVLTDLIQDMQGRGERQA